MPRTSPGRPRNSQGFASAPGQAGGSVCAATNLDCADSAHPSGAPRRLCRGHGQKFGVFDRRSGRLAYSISFGIIPARHLPNEAWQITFRGGRTMRKVIAVALGVGLLMGVPWTGSAQRPGDLSKFMVEKLDNSKKLLEGIALSDFTKIANSAERLIQ